MKLKNVISNITLNAILCFLLIFFLPFLLLVLVVCILYTPIDYIKFKRSAYQKDFPRKYKWLCGRHVDNRIYTIIKENDLPISYLRFYDDYESWGKKYSCSRWLRHDVGRMSDKRRRDTNPNVGGGYEFCYGANHT